MWKIEAGEGMTIEEEIGSGSFGTVYRVRIDGKDYAMKRMRVPQGPEEEKALLRKLGDATSVKEYCRDIARELLKEAEVLRDLKGEPNIASILDYRMEETETGFEITFLMEYLEPFSEYEVTHKMEEADVIRMGLDLCSALEACEKRGILHRDLKPDNILMKDGAFQICDFGVAKNLEKTCVTASVQGTFSYMAPEVYFGKKYDTRADIYSLGMILYRISNNGRVPFLSPGERMVRYKEEEEAFNRRINGEELPAPAFASPELAEILMKACAYYPEKRYASASDMKKDLLLLQQGRYKVKGKGTIRSGKRTAKDYGKAALALTGVLVVLLLAAWGALYFYRARFVNLCDPAIQAKIAEEYGITTGPRLDGNGVLYIDRKEDLYCTTSTGEYPWMDKKDQIRKIVFGEQVTDDEAFRNEILTVTQNEIYVEYNGFQVPTRVNIVRIDYNAYMSGDSFSRCLNLREIVIQGDSFYFMTGIDFTGCKNLEVIQCPKDTEVFLTGDAGLSDTAWYQKEGCQIIGSTLLRYNGSETIIDTLPGHITHIVAGAFKENEQVTEIFLPESLREIGAEAFYACSSLKMVHMPDQVVKIETAAFGECVALEEMTIPEQAELSDRVFIGCRSLRNLTVQPGNPYCTVVDGALYNADQTDLLWCSPCVEGTFVIPDSVQRINGYAMQDCLFLTKVVFPENYEGGVAGLFGESPYLTEIVIPETNPYGKKEGPLVLSKGGDELILCLRDAAGEIAIPERVRAIDEYAFYGCGEIERITVPDTVGFLFNSAFENCTSLTQINLPAAVKMIANRAFAGCTSLTDIYYGGTKEAWERLTGRFDLGFEEEKTEVHFTEAN